MGAKAHHLSDCSVAPPDWRWYRINPCPPNCGEHGWHYGDGTEGQRGSFIGAKIVVQRQRHYDYPTAAPVGAVA